MKRAMRTTVYCQLPQFTIPCTITADDPPNVVDTLEPMVSVKWKVLPGTCVSVPADQFPV